MEMTYKDRLLIWLFYSLKITGPYYKSDIENKSKVVSFLFNTTDGTYFDYYISKKYSKEIYLPVFFIIYNNIIKCGGKFKSLPHSVSAFKQGYKYMYWDTDIYQYEYSSFCTTFNDIEDIVDVNRRIDNQTEEHTSLEDPMLDSYI